MNAANNHYKKNKLEGASDLESVVLLYNEAIAKITLAKESYVNDKQSPDVRKHIDAALTVIRGLTLLLNFKEGGVVAQNLYSLYNYMDKRLIVAREGIWQTPKYCDEVISMLNNLRESWDKIAKDEKQRKSIQHVGNELPLSPGNLEISI